ncbi:MAG: transporter, TatB family [Acidobacteriales bacterium]|nr:transporter, TatB family [Terriglobales bacterium]
MAFLVILGLLLFGPKKLPEIGRQIGRILAEFKRASNEFQAQLNEEVRNLEIEAETKAHFDDLKQSILPPEGSTARNPFSFLEPNSGEHQGEAPELRPPVPTDHISKEPNA